MADRMKARRGSKEKMDLKMYEIGYATDEKRMYIQDDSGAIPLPNKEDIDVINEKVDNSSSIYINETLPEIVDRNEKTLYFKITDTLSSLGNNVTVSPTMGLKEVTE